MSPAEAFLLWVVFIAAGVLVWTVSYHFGYWAGRRAHPAPQPGAAAPPQAAGEALRRNPGSAAAFGHEPHGDVAILGRWPAPLPLRRDRLS